QRLFFTHAGFLSSVSGCGIRAWVGETHPVVQKALREAVEIIGPPRLMALVEAIYGALRWRTIPKSESTREARARVASRLLKKLDRHVTLELEMEASDARMDYVKRNRGEFLKLAP